MGGAGRDAGGGRGGRKVGVVFRSFRVRSTLKYFASDREGVRAVGFPPVLAVLVGWKRVFLSLCWRGVSVVLFFLPAIISLFVFVEDGTIHDAGSPAPCVLHIRHW